MKKIIWASIADLKKKGKKSFSMKGKFPCPVRGCDFIANSVPSLGGHQGVHRAAKLAAVPKSKSVPHNQKLTPDQKRQVISLTEQGISIRDIAAQLGVNGQRVAGYVRFCMNLRPPIIGNVRPTLADQHKPEIRLKDEADCGSTATLTQMQASSVLQPSAKDSQLRRMLFSALDDCRKREQRIKAMLEVL